jgi:hypothetical protein
VSGDGFAKSEKGYTSTSSAYRQNGSLLRGSRRHAPGPGPRQEGPGVRCVAGDPGRARLRGPEDATADDGLGAAGARGRRLRRASSSAWSARPSPAGSSARSRVPDARRDRWSFR